MNVSDLVKETGWTVLAGDPSKEISGAYVCDLLSWVMGRGEEGTAWITVQTHLNVIAVASLHQFACVIIPDSIEIDPEVIRVAQEKDVCILSAPCTAYGAAAIMAKLEIGEI